MTTRYLGSLGPSSGPLTHLWRVGTVWRHRYEIRCEVCGLVSRAHTPDIGWIRVAMHRIAHHLGLRRRVSTTKEGSHE